MPSLFWVGLLLGLLAAILYFLFLPLLEGSSLREQAVDAKSWLGQRPHCQKWAWQRPLTTDAHDPRRLHKTNDTNGYKCGHCAPAGRKFMIVKPSANKLIGHGSF